MTPFGAILRPGFPGCSRRAEESHIQYSIQRATGFTDAVLRVAEGTKEKQQIL
jgi:hypothetical protein